MFDRLAGFFFGRDVFVSYSFDDSRYAEALAVALQGRKFSVFLGGWGASPGEALSWRVRRAAELCKLLVVVATAKAVDSAAVWEEIALAAKHQTTVVPINVGGAIVDRRKWPGTDPVPEEPDVAPSPNVLDRIENAATFARQETRLRRSVLATVLSIAALLAAGGRSGWKIRDAAAITAVNAHIQELRAKTAAQRASIADRQARTARHERRRQEEIAGALQLANDANQLLQREPARLVQAALLATAATRRLHAHGVRALAADTAIRSALMLMPKVERTMRVAIGGNTSAFSRGGRFIATNAKRNIITVYDIDLGTVKELDPGGDVEFISELAISADGETVAASFFQKHGRGIRVWRVRDGRMIGSHDSPQTPLIALSEDGRSIAISDRDLHEFTVRGSDGRGAERTISCGDRMYGLDRLQFSPSGRLLAFNGSPAGIWEWQTSDDPLFSPENASAAVAFDPADETIVATAASQYPIAIWRWRDWKPGAAPLWSDVEAQRTSFGFSPDGRRLVYITADAMEPRVAFRNGWTPRVSVLIEGSASDRSAATGIIAGDSGAVAVTYVGNSATLFQGTSAVSRFAPATTVVGIRRGNAISIAGNRATYWSASRFLVTKISDTTSPMPKKRLPSPIVDPHGRFVAIPGGTALFASFSPSGQFVVTGAQDRIARVWSGLDSTPVEVARLDTFGESAWAGFSDDERHVLVRNGDQLVRHPWRQEDLLDAACKRLPSLIAPDQRSLFAEACPAR